MGGPSNPPLLSKRTREALERGADSPLSTALFKTFGNQWSPDNPEGVINAGLAENSLMNKWLQEFWARPGSMKLKDTDLTYGTSILGSERLFLALSSYYSRYFSPIVPVEPLHIATSNGMSPMLEHLATVISDEGDCWVLPAPWYNGFRGDLEATAKVRIVSVEVEMGKEGEIEEVEAMEREMQRRKDAGNEAKVTAVLLTNPSNPLGFCYKPETLLEYARFAEKWGIFLVCDEIYALSVFQTESSTWRPFTSILSLDVLKEAECSPSRIIQTYGLSKDFGANGLRGANLVCQHNPSVLQGLTTTAMMMRIGSPTDVLWSNLINSEDLDYYLKENQRRLGEGYKFLSTWLKHQNLPFRESHAGHFLLADFSNVIKSMVPKSEGENEEVTTQREVALLNRLVEGGVFINPGASLLALAVATLKLCTDEPTIPGYSYCVSRPGWFRMTFSIQPRELVLALSRIEKVCELDERVLEMSQQSQFSAYGSRT
ncbi:uncharacterized protein JCM6883_001224 [Sporobolomyces salmoneus]|uniref:uncharacterized protein n=1 Tax=Sporobolomyces salmoneus TaxID=183962 RepID=UPI003179A6D2